MNRREYGILGALIAAFLFAFFVDFSDREIQNAVMESFHMLQWYARYHTLTCVVPAMFIAGAIATFFSST